MFVTTKSRFKTNCFRLKKNFNFYVSQKKFNDITEPWGILLFLMRYRFYIRVCEFFLAPKELKAAVEWFPFKYFTVSGVWVRKI